MLVSGLILKKNTDFWFLIMKMKKSSFMIKLVLVLDHIWIWKLSQNHNFPKMFNLASEKWIFRSHFHRNPDTSSGFFFDLRFLNTNLLVSLHEKWLSAFFLAPKIQNASTRIFFRVRGISVPGIWYVWTHFTKSITITITGSWIEKSVHKNFSGYGKSRYPGLICVWMIRSWLEDLNNQIAKIIIAAELGGVGWNWPNWPCLISRFKQSTHGAVHKHYSQKTC